MPLANSNSKNKQYHFNLQDSSYYISLNITKKKHLSEPELKLQSKKCTILNTECDSVAHSTRFENIRNERENAPNSNCRPKSRLDKILDYNNDTTNIINHQKRLKY